MAKMLEASPLQSYLTLANFTKGPLAVHIVLQALADPLLYVFGELLDHPNIKVLKITDEPYFNLLNVFAYGTWETYKAFQANLPIISEQMKQKLKLLTIATLATKEKNLDYQVLMEILDIENNRQLEDLIIDGITAKVFNGKLDQIKNRFQVNYVKGRDVAKVRSKNMVLIR